jgi:hypothetical protein
VAAIQDAKDRDFVGRWSQITTRGSVTSNIVDAIIGSGLDLRLQLFLLHAGEVMLMAAV